MEARQAGETSKRRIHPLAGLLLLTASTAAALALAEAALRITKLHIGERLHAPLIYVPNEQTGFRYPPGSRGRFSRSFDFDNTVVINDEGFHEPQRTSPRAGTTVLVLGDSFTAALAVPAEATWPHITQQSLRAGGREVDVIARGLDGTGTDVHLALLERELNGYTPDLVVLAFYENDPSDVLAGAAYRTVHDRWVLTYQTPAQRDRMIARLDDAPPAPIEWILGHSCLARAAAYYALGVNNRFRTNSIKPGTFGIAWEMPAGRSTTGGLDVIMRRFDELATDRGFEFLVIEVPSRFGFENSGRALDDAVSPEVRAALTIIDPAPEIRERLAADGKRHRNMYWTVDSHFNGYGNRVFGEVVAGIIAPRLGPPSDPHGPTTAP